MLEGFVPFPEAFVKRYKEKGYWADKTIGDEFDEFTVKYADRVAISFQGEQVTYRAMGERVNRLALHFVDKGLKTYDRMICQLPNEPEFLYCFYAAIKIGVIPIAALPAHQDAEISFFARFTGARCHAIPSKYKPFSHQELSRRIRQQESTLEFTFVSGDDVDDGFISINDLLNDRIEERVPVDSLKRYRPDPMEPAVFQLSGGTTGVPKVIPRTHNDYSANFRRAAEILNFTKDSIIGIAIPISHNFAMSSPGFLGTLYNGGRVVPIDLQKQNLSLKPLNGNK